MPGITGSRAGDAQAWQFECADTDGQQYPLESRRWHRRGEEMPEVLEYASPATPKHRRWRADFDLALVSLLQIGAWLWAATKPFYREPVPGNQYSFFAAVWRYDQLPLVGIAFGLVTSLAIGITAFRSYEKRAFWYRGYVIVIVVGPFLDFIPHAYLMSQMNDSSQLAVRRAMVDSGWLLRVE